MVANSAAPKQTKFIHTLQVDKALHSTDMLIRFMRTRAEYEAAMKSNLEALAGLGAWRRDSMRVAGALHLFAQICERRLCQG